MIGTVILASASQARTRLLSDAGVVHVCDPADIDETALKNQWTGPAEGLAQRLAEEKARVVSLRQKDHWVIGADQVLALGQTIFDKPENIKAAREQLLALRGRSHRLISGVSLVRNGDLMWSHYDSAKLYMRSFSNTFLEDYLKRVGDQVSSSVGAYHLEGLGAQLFDAVEGDFFTVLGLPLVPLLKALRAQDILPE